MALHQAFTFVLSGPKPLIRTDLNNRINNLYFMIDKVNEFATFLKGVREWNTKADASHQIELYGIDTFAGAGSANPIPTIKTFLDSNQIVMDQELKVLNAFNEKYGTGSPVDIANAEAAAVKLDAAVSALPPTTQGKLEVNIMTHGLLRFTQGREISSDNFSTVTVDKLLNTVSNIPYNGIRDAGMAENIKLLMAGKVAGNDKTVYWAHNGHIARISALDGELGGFLSAWGTAGSMLNAWLGDDYAPIAIATGAGSARLMVMDAQGQPGDPTPVPLPPPPSDSLNAIASERFPGKAIFFLTGDIPFLGFVRPEILISFVYEPTTPGHIVVNNIPGLAFYGIISVPLSHASTDVPQDNPKDPKS
jgi:erythromycin esterase-like protein